MGGLWLSLDCVVENFEASQEGPAIRVELGRGDVDVAQHGANERGEGEPDSQTGEHVLIHVEKMEVAHVVIRAAKPRTLGG